MKINFQNVNINSPSVTFQKRSNSNPVFKTQPEPSEVISVYSDSPIRTKPAQLSLFALHDFHGQNLRMERAYTVVEKFEVKDNKTKGFIKLLNTLKLEGKTLVVVKELTDELILASRNLKDIKVIESHEINTYDVLNYKNIVITEEAVKMLEEVL